ncbi:MAG: MtrB/PioB family decaheme-associated outer membrane protein [Gammaproteobacteria bacterium]
MNMKTPGTIINLLIAVISPVAAVAAEQTETEPLSNTIEVGIGALSEDAFRFGRYTGITDQGVYLVGDIDARDFLEDGTYWQVRGTDLGLDSRYLRLKGGIRGQQQYFLEVDMLPNNESDSARTPTLGVGSSVLTLPPGFDITTSLGTALQPFDIATQRERVGLGASLFTEQRWRLKVAVSHETREGIDRIGGAIANGSGGGGGASGGIVGNTTASLLPEPIDYVTDLMDISLQYAKDDAQFSIAYHVSLFDNEHNSLRWEDPFAPGVFGSQALAPDNEFHQVSLAGSYALPWRSQLSGLVSTGRITQNQAFQPYTINPAVITEPLPRSSLDAEVSVSTLQLKLSSRPVSKLRLNAQYRYDKRDNDTRVDSFDTVVADSFNRAGTVQNRPLSYDRKQVKLGANYRINTAMSLRGGYRYDDMSRDYANAEREDTRENTVFAKWKIKPHADVDLALYAETGERTGSDYTALSSENPALRKYYLADRVRRKAGASVEYQAADNLSLGASADRISDDYKNSDIGLTESSQPSVTLDISWQPREDMTTYAFYNREDISSSQAGSEAATVTPDWTAEFEDSVDTLGLGATVEGIHDKWDLGADLVYSSSQGMVELINLAPGGAITPYPELKTALTSVKLWTRYRYRKDVSLKLAYWYESYRADDWSLDNLQADSVSNLLLLDEQTPDYNAYVVVTSVIVHF